jgi:hypothetical protein
MFATIILLLASFLVTPAQAAAPLSQTEIARLVQVAQPQFENQLKPLIAHDLGNINSPFPDISNSVEYVALAHELSAFAAKLDSAGSQATNAAVSFNDCHGLDAVDYFELICNKSLALTLSSHGVEYEPTYYFEMIRLRFSTGVDRKLTDIFYPNINPMNAFPTDLIGFKAQSAGAPYAPRSTRLIQPITGWTGLSTASKLLAVAHALEFAGPGLFDPNYRVYSADCTNFVSQAMEAAGWQYLGTGTVNATADAHYWFYSDNATPIYSYTSQSWSVANKLFQFSTLYTSRAKVIGIYNDDEAKLHQTDLFPGDLVFVEWDGVSGEPKEHVAIVTNRGNGIVKISQHTTNRRNSEFSGWVNIAALDKPNATYFFVRT